MPDYITQDFESKELEILDAISVLKKHGANIPLSEAWQKQVQARTLFDGDDTLFKELIKILKYILSMGVGNPQSLFTNILKRQYMR